MSWHATSTAVANDSCSSSAGAGRQPPPRRWANDLISMRAAAASNSHLSRTVTNRGQAARPEGMQSQKSWKASLVDDTRTPRVSNAVPSTSSSLAAVEGGDSKRGAGAATSIICLGRYSGFTYIQPMDRDYLVCLALLILRPSWCDTRGPLRLPSSPGPSLRHPAISRAQPVPRGKTWSAALSGLDGPPDTTTILVCPAGPPAQSSPKHSHSLTQSLTHKPFEVRPSHARSLVP